MLKKLNGICDLHWMWMLHRAEYSQSCKPNLHVFIYEITKSPFHSVSSNWLFSCAKWNHNVLAFIQVQMWCAWKTSTATTQHRSWSASVFESSRWNKTKQPKITELTNFVHSTVSMKWSGRLFVCLSIICTCAAKSHNKLPQTISSDVNFKFEQTQCKK